MTISVNEQVTGHKVTVRPAARAELGQRHAGCECGWQSGIGSTEQVMPEIRTHLEAALAATSHGDRRPSLAPGPSGAETRDTGTPGGRRSTPKLS